MLNYLWLGLILCGVVLGVLTGRTEALTAATFDACKSSLMTIALPLGAVMALWLGIMRLAEKSGAVERLSGLLRPLLIRLFPDVPADHPAMGAMVMNIAANMLGLGNAATPLGLRAMQGLESLNPRPGTATNAMCTFLAINTSSVQLIPATAVGILAAAGATHPTAIIGTALVATTCSFLTGITSVKLLQRLPMFALPPLEHAVGTILRSTENVVLPSSAPPPPPRYHLASCFFPSFRPLDRYYHHPIDLTGRDPLSHRILSTLCSPPRRLCL